MKRPRLAWSTVAVSSARRSGWVSGKTCTAVPILMRLVRAAICPATFIGALSTLRLACWWISASQNTSSPQRSAASTCSNPWANASASDCPATCRWNSWYQPNSMGVSFPAAPASLGASPSFIKCRSLIPPITARHDAVYAERTDGRGGDGTAQPALLCPHRRARQHHPRGGASPCRPAGADPPHPAPRRRAVGGAVHPRQSRRAADRGRAEAARRRLAHPARPRTHRRRDPRPGRASQRQDRARHHPDAVPGAGARAVRADAPRLPDDRIEGDACRHGAARRIHHRRARRHRLDVRAVAQPADPLDPARRRGDGAGDPGPVAAAELRQTGLILGDGLRAAMDALLAGLGIELKVEIEINDHETMLLMVQQGVGASILPYSSVTKPSLRGLLEAHRITESGIFRTLALGVRASRSASQAREAVARSIAEAVAELDAEGRLALAAAPPRRLRRAAGG